MKRTLLFANLLASVTISAFFAFLIQADRLRIIEDAERDVTNLRDALNEHTHQMFSALRMALGGVSERVEVAGFDGDVLHEALRSRQQTFAPIYALFVLNEEGTLAATSRMRQPQPVNLADTTMFTAHRANPDLGLHISKPRVGRVGFAEGQWIVNVSHRINYSDGSFRGVVAATLSVDRLTDFYDAWRIGEDGVVGIITDDGDIIARSPIDPSPMRRNIADIGIVAGSIPPDELGVFRASFGSDQIDRTIAFSRVRDFPLFVYVGVSMEDRLSGWRRRASFDGIIGLASILFLGAFSYFFVQRIEEKQDEQEGQVEQLTALTALSTQLVGCSDIQAVLQEITDAARQLVPCHMAVTSFADDPSLSQSIYAVSLSPRYEKWKSFDQKPDGSGIYRLVCEKNEPMRLTQLELTAHPAWREFGEAKQCHPPLNGWLAVPLIAAEGENLGVIQLSDREEGNFTAKDQALLVELAHIASVALQQINLTEALRDSVRVAEKLEYDARAAQEAEMQARSEIEDVLVSIRDAVFALDAAWRFTYLNPQAEMLLERNRDDLLGCKLWDEFPDVVESEAYAQYHKAVNEQVDVDFRFYFSPLSRWFDVRAFPQGGGGLTVYFQDVSAWVKQEEELRQSQKMDAIGRLTGGVAHDFNNLLTVIIGNSEAVLEDLDKNSRNHHLISMISDAAERAADLTHRLLAFSRRQALDPKPIDVNHLLSGELLPLLKRTLGEQFELRLSYKAGIRRALVDASQLQSAVVNLVVNARDAMRDGGDVTIETDEVALDQDDVDKQSYATPGRYIRVAVTDTGGGMAPEVQARIFEPFFTTKPIGEGTGLGLPMVYGFVRQSRGHINVYSEVGLGTTIELFLPCAEPNGRAEIDHEAVMSVERGTEKILVIEDDPLVREYASSTLITLGYDVTAVDSGKAALDILDADQTFALLLCDVILGGGMNGRQVADAARHRIPEIKVLYMSGYTENVIVHHGRLDAGVNLLSKPFRRAELAARVREAIRR